MSFSAIETRYHGLLAVLLFVYVRLKILVDHPPRGISFSLDFCSKFTTPGTFQNVKWGEKSRMEKSFLCEKTLACGENLLSSPTLKWLIIHFCLGLLVKFYTFFIKENQMILVKARCFYYFAYFRAHLFFYFVLVTINLKFKYTRFFYEKSIF